MFMVSGALADPTSPAVFRINPTKSIPILTDTNWAEWSWRISSAFIAIGMASSCLFMSQESIEPKDEELVSVDINAARAAIAQAESDLDVCTTASARKPASQQLQVARSDLVKAIAEERQRWETTVDTSNPFSGLSTSIQVNCFQLIVKTITPDLDFLVMGFEPSKLQQCWTGIRDYFQINTRGSRNQLKVAFFTLTMEPTMKFAVFKQKIDFAAKQLNSMSPRQLITDEDKTTVLMHGLRRHHGGVFKTILDILEQSVEEITFEEAYKRIIPTARRSETNPESSETKEALRPSSSHFNTRPLQKLCQRHLYIFNLQILS